MSRLPDRGEASRAFRFGIVSTMRDPLNIHAWLEHNRNLGVRRFFITVDRSPWLVVYLLSQRDVSVRHCEHDIVGYEFWNIQSQHVNAFLDDMSEYHISHVLHIDDDELIHVNARDDFVRLMTSDPSVLCWCLQNLEALAENENVTSPFSECRLFCTNKTQFAAYANGKSIGYVERGARCAGAHRFSGKEMWVPPNTAVVLHFDSIVLRRFRKKMEKYRRENGREQCRTKRIPFKFYCDAINASTPNVLKVWHNYKRYEPGRHKVLFINPRFQAPAMVIVGNTPMKGKYGALIDAFP